MFTMRGRMPEDESNHTYEVTWYDAGYIDGEEPAVSAFRYMSDRLEGLPLGPVWRDPVYSDHCSDPFAVQFIAARVFMPDWTLSGDVPSVPSIPSGAIG